MASRDRDMDSFEGPIVLTTTYLFLYLHKETLDGYIRK